MSDLVLIIQVIAGLFALYGLCEFIKRFVDMYVICRSGAVCKIVLHTSNEDPEYAIRFAESRFFGGDYADFFDTLEIADSVDIDTDTFNNLKAEFKNISK